MLGSLGEVLPHAARRFGDGRALVAGDRSFSFAELDALSSALAVSLVNRGVGPGDRVTLYAPNSWEWIVSYYGALKAGAVINPVNVMLTPAEVAFVTADCGAKALIGSPEKIGRRARGGRRGSREHRVRGRAGRRRDAVRRAHRRRPRASIPFRLRQMRSRRSATRRARRAARRARCSRIARSC